MKSKPENNEKFTQSESLAVIREMIRISQLKLHNDGILFILWGWLLFLIAGLGFLERSWTMPQGLQSVFRISGVIAPFVVLAYTVYYVLRQRRLVQTYIGVSLRYVWISLFVSMVLVNLIQFNVLQQINFELQHPLFMVLMAFATTITGGILRYRLIIGGGIIFGVLAYVASKLNLREQLLLEAVAWLIAFVIPGHILFYRRKASE